jgi:hypothetical protein
MNNMNTPTTTAIRAKLFSQFLKEGALSLGELETFLPEFTRQQIVQAIAPMKIEKLLDSFVEDGHPTYKLTDAGKAAATGKPLPTPPQATPSAAAPAPVKNPQPAEGILATNNSPATEPKAQPSAAIPSTKPQEQSMTSAKHPAAAPVRGSTQAIIDAITVSPGIRRGKLIATVLKVVPGITEKKITDLLYQMASVKKIKTNGDGEERTYHLGESANKKRATAKPPKAQKGKLVTGAAARKAASSAKPKTPRRCHPPAAPAPAPSTLDAGFRFAFGIRQDGGIAIAKNGTTLELTAHEAQAILAHATL